MLISMIDVYLLVFIMGVDCRLYCLLILLVFVVLTLLVCISVSLVHLSSLFVDGTFVANCYHCFF